MSDRDFQFNNLQPEKILATITQLAKRIRERFPESSLAVLGEELRGVALEASDRAERIRKPIIALRVASGLLVAFIIIGVFGTVLTLENKDAALSLAEFIQLLEAGINDIVLIGAGIFFLFTLETRIKRNRALEAIHELRSLAHIIDMHQLTKDMTRMEHTQSSPVRPMTPAQLERYLDYCSEMLSLVGKIAALYIQHFNETVAIAAVTEVENLTTGLSRKIWQKITLIENHDERMRVREYRDSSYSEETTAESNTPQLDQEERPLDKTKSDEKKETILDKKGLQGSNIEDKADKKNPKDHKEDDSASDNAKGKADEKESLPSKSRSKADETATKAPETKESASDKAKDKADKKESLPSKSESKADEMATKAHKGEESASDDVRSKADKTTTTPDTKDPVGKTKNR